MKFNSALYILTTFFGLNTVNAEEVIAKKDLPFWDHTLPLEERLDDLISRMTIEEKVENLSANPGGIARLQVAPYQHWNHSAHGICGSLTYPNSKSVIYPTPINQAATFNPELIELVGECIGEEGRAKYHMTGERRKTEGLGGLSFWNPTVNMARDPRWGRTNEAYGEDPFLAGKISAAYVLGMQGGKDPEYFLTIAAPKHFVANNDERIRMYGNADVPMRALREYYLRPFRECIVEGGAYQIMSAYNKLNGTPCVANSWLLQDLLRGEWGFEGYAVSDASAVINMYSKMGYVESPLEAAVKAVENGTDISIGSGFFVLNTGAKEGLLTPKTLEAIDRACKNQFRSRFRLGEFDPPELVKWTKITPEVIQSKKHQNASLETARESIILLKNERADGNPVLPLDPSKIKKLLICGPNMDADNYGSYHNQRKNSLRPLNAHEGLKSLYGDQFEIISERGVRIPGNRGHGNEGINEKVDEEYASFEGKPGWRGEYFNNKEWKGEPVAVRQDKAVWFKWKEPPAEGMPKDNYTVRWTANVVPKQSKTYQLHFKSDDAGKLVIDDEVLVDSPNSYTGTVNKHLNEGQSYKIVIELRENGGETVAQFGWDLISPLKIARQKADKVRRQKEDKEGIIRAAKRAAECDAAIVVVGTNGLIEAEGNDRENYDFPGLQQELVEAVSKANPNTIVVLQNGSSMPLERIKAAAPAILETFFIGPDMGESYTDIIFGKVNPSGKLPLTFYKEESDLVAMDNYDLINNPRTYLYFEKPVTFAFGHGLSYTTFAYSNLKLSSKTIKDGDVVEVKVDITNTGEMTGKEVIQLYAHDQKASVKRPQKELVAFTKVALNPGETQTVSLKMEANDLRFWDKKNDAWKLERGTFDLLVGSASDDIRVTAILKAK
jgi:beta-glucosidase